MDSKIHCQHCGKKRYMQLGFSYLDEDQTNKLQYVNVRSVLKMSQNNTLPRNFPKELIGFCPTCLKSGFYELKPGRIILKEL